MFLLIALCAATDIEVCDAENGDAGTCVSLLQLRGGAKKDLQQGQAAEAAEDTSETGSGVCCFWSPVQGSEFCAACQSEAPKGSWCGKNKNRCEGPCNGKWCGGGAGQGDDEAKVPLYGQCGGNQYTGPKTCVHGVKCVRQDAWYSQCLPGTEDTTPAPAPEESTPAPAPEDDSTPAPAPDGDPTPAPAPEGDDVEDETTTEGEGDDETETEGEGEDEIPMNEGDGEDE